MTKDEALKLALSALDEVRQEIFRLMRDGQKLYAEEKVWSTIISIKEVLAQPEQEPVAYGMWDTMIGCGGRMMMVRLDKGQDGCTVPLYAYPPQPKKQETVAKKHEPTIDLGKYAGTYGGYIKE